MLCHLNAVKNGNLVDVIFDSNAKLGGAAWNVGLGALATANVILSDGGRQACQELCLLTVVDLEGQKAFLVVKLELLDKGELLAEFKEVAVLLGLLWLVGLNVRELVVHVDWHVVVVVHCEVLHVEVRREDGAVESCTPGNAL